MSASKKGKKKVVNQEELRRLMREKQKQSSDKKRVQSPFAKYNSLSQLSCVLCGVHVKSELLWPAHILGKQHKEKVSELKEARSLPGKRSAAADGEEQEEQWEEERDRAAKKARAAGPPGSSVPGEGAPCPRSAGLSLLAGVYEEEEEEGEEEQEEQEEQGGRSAHPHPPQQQPRTEGLPADFFDSSIPSIPPATAISHSGSILKAEAPPPPADKSSDKTAEVLPEGFFDDPVRDAKVRNVDAPKDQMDKEWEEFQKEIRQVNTKSEAIVAEDDEEGRLERQIDEIDEQIECYKRVEVLRDRREVVRRRAAAQQEVRQQQQEEQEEEEVQEEELLGLLAHDWRAKGALA